jgi:hypothetical protein
LCVDGSDGPAKQAEKKCYEDWQSERDKLDAHQAELDKCCEKLDYAPVTKEEWESKGHQVPKKDPEKRMAKRGWMVDRVHGLPAVAAPSFFPSSSRNEDIWWGSQDMKTVYLWDSMDDQDRQNTMTVHKESTEWTIWKTKDKRWTPLLRQAGYHQLLDIHKNKQSDCWGFMGF